MRVVKARWVSIVITIIGASLPLLARAELQVITVPQSVMNLDLPHYTTWERDTRFKAIARGGDGSYDVEWDFDGDGTYNAPFTVTDRYDLSAIFRFDSLPDANPAETRVYLAAVRVTSGAEVAIGTYPVAVIGDVTVAAMVANPLGYPEEKMNVLRQIAIDEALWWGHNQFLERTDEGTNTISGYVNHRPILQDFERGYRATCGAFIWAMGLNGHFPAYPPGTYLDYGVTPPVGWLEANDSRYNNDPYGEDTLRCLNFLLFEAQVVNLINPVEPEADDLDGNGLTPNGYPPIPETNNGQGIRWQNGYAYTQAHAMAALSLAGLEGTVAQVGSVGVIGKTFEYLVQEAVDCGIDAMNDTNSGWDYYPNTSRYDGSTTQWMFFGLETAKNLMSDHGVYLNQYAQGMTAKALVCGQGTSHTATNGFSYGGGPSCVSSGGSVNLTGGGPVGAALLGWEDPNQFNCDNAQSDEQPYMPYSTLTRCQCRTRYDAFNLWLANHFNSHWNDNNYNSGSQTAGNIYAIYSTMKGARAASTLLTHFGTHDWNRKFSVYLIRAQYSDGHYMSADGFISQDYTGKDLNTYYSVMTAAPPTFLVAVANVSPLKGMIGCGEWVDGVDITFRHADSYHVYPRQTLVTYQWDFDDCDGLDWENPDYETSDPDASVVHRYSQEGVFTATLRVTDDSDPPKENIVSVGGITIISSNMAPTVRMTSPNVIAEGNNLLLKAIGDDANLPCDELTYSWDLDNDGIFDEASGPAPLIPWQDLSVLSVGNHDICVRVEDQEGASAEDCDVLTITSMDILACFTATPDLVGCNEEISFDGACSSTIPENTITEWSWDWNTDGVYEDTGQIVTHSFTTLGQNPVRLLVSDDRPANSRIQTEIVTVIAQPPVANAGGPYSSAEGMDVSLNGAASDPDEPCGDTIVAYRWDIDNNGLFDDAEGPTPTLPWAGLLENLSHPATNSISLEVEDSNGLTSTAQTTLTINAPVPVAVAEANPMESGCSTEIVFDGSQSYHQSPTGSIATYTWDFDIHHDADGDGDPANDNESNQAQAIHVYRWEPEFLVAGPHEAQLTVTDEQELLSTDTVTVTVTLPPQPPTADAGGPYRTAIVGGNPYSLVLDGGQSSDPMPTCDGIVMYEWDMDTDGTPDVTTEDPPCLLDEGLCQRFEYINAEWQVGTHQVIQLRVTDTQGLVSQWDQTTIDVEDHIPPMVEVISPNGGEFLRGQVWVNYRASYQDGGSVRVVATMEGQTIGEATVDLQAGGAWTLCQDGGCALALNTTQFQDKYASYVVTVTAYDDWGISNIDISNGPFTVDNTPPVLVVDPETIQTEQTNLDGTPVTINATATDALDNSPVVTFNPTQVVYPLGLNVVTVTATDHAGNEAQDFVEITIVDTTAPVLEAGEDISVEAQSPSGTEAAITPQVSDICDASPAVVLSDEGPFALGGPWEVTVTATDITGNYSTDTIMVTVTDSTPPSMDLPITQIILEQLSPLGTPLDQAGLPVPILSDNGYPSDQLTWGHNAPDPLPPGETTVTYWAMDPSENLQNTELTVVVQDTQAPEIVIISAPTGIIATDGVVIFTVMDIATANPTVILAPTADLQREDTTYTATYTEDGEYSLTITATDGAGRNSQDTTVSFTIDRTPPDLVAPQTVRVEQVSLDGAPATIDIQATDSLSGLQEITMAPPLEVYPLGTTQVTVTATDMAGNQSPGVTVEVIIEDTTPPSVEAGSDIEMEAQGPEGTSVPFAPVVSDLCDAAVEVAISPSGPFLPGPPMEVTVTATDASGNSASDTLWVTILDRGAPQIALPGGDWLVERMGPFGIPLEEAALPAPDLQDAGYGAESLTWGHDAPPVFPLGETTVTYWAEDPSENHSQAQLRVVCR